MFRKRQNKHLGWQLIQRLWRIILAVVSGLQAKVTHQPKQHRWQRQRRIARQTTQLPILLLNRPRRFWRFLTTAITVFIFTINLNGITPWFSSPALAAAQLTITPISWNILGLDSNNVNVGPNTYMTGARVCNIGDTTATNVKATFVREGAVNPYINLQAASTLSVASLPAGSPPPSQYTINYTPTNCTDFYYNIVVTRTAAAYNTIQRFRIDATADGLGIVSTPTPRELYVEKILSQARNSVLSWTGPTTVYQGQVYQYTTVAKTATAYPQLTFLADFPNTVFQLLSAKTTYSLPAGAINSTIYADACGWVNDPTSPDYHRSATNCNLPDNYSGGAAGNNVTTVYTVKILSTGTTSVSNLIYDFSGGSYHYNADYGMGINSITITALQPPPADLTLTKTHTGNFTQGSTGTYTIVATNSGGISTNNLVTVSDTLPIGLTPTAASGTGWSCTISGQTVSCTRSDALAPNSSYPPISLSVAVASNAAANLTNTATVSGGGQTNTSNDTANDPTAITPVSDLTLTKTHTGDFTRGSTGTYAIAVTNTGGAATSGLVTVNDTLPTGLTATTVSGTGWTCTVASGGGLFSCTRNDALASGSSYPTLTVNVNVAANTPESVTNTAIVSGGGEINTLNNSYNDPTKIVSIADLSISKTDGQTSITPGSSITYTITVTNNGLSTVTNVTVNDTVPATIQNPVFTPSTGTYNSSTGVWTGLNLASGQSITLTLKGTVSSSATGTITNIATVAPPSGVTDSNNNNNSATDNTTVSSDGCNLGGGTFDGAIAPYISPEVTNNVTATRSLVDTLDDAWRMAAGGVSSGTVQPWFGTSSSLGSVSSFTYLDPSTSSTVNATVQLVLVNISGTTNCAGISNTTSSTPLLATSAALQNTSPRPASLYNSANQPAFWNQTIVSGNDARRFAARFTFNQPVKSFGAWFGDLETRTTNGTPAILRLLDASGNRIGNDIVIQPTTIYDGNPPDPEAVDQAQCGSTAANIGCGNSSTRWVGFVDSRSTPRVSQVLVIVGDDDFNDDGDTEILSFIGANTIPVASNPNLLLVKRITAINGVEFTNFVDDPNSNNDNASNWPTPTSTYLRGAINSTVKPGDEVEYTIYFLSNGSKNATNVKLCDLVPSNTTFVPTAFNGSTPTEGGIPGSDRGIALALNSTSLPASPTLYLTNTGDTDRGQFFTPGTSLPTACSGNNTSGSVVVSVVTAPHSLPPATAPGTPSNSYGFIRFRVKVQ